MSSWTYLLAVLSTLISIAHARDRCGRINCANMGEYRKECCFDIWTNAWVWLLWTVAFLLLSCCICGCRRRCVVQRQVRQLSPSCPSYSPALNVVSLPPPPPTASQGLYPSAPAYGTMPPPYSSIPATAFTAYTATSAPPNPPSYNADKPPDYAATMNQVQAQQQQQQQQQQQ